MAHKRETSGELSAGDQKLPKLSDETNALRGGDKSLGQLDDVSSKGSSVTPGQSVTPQRSPAPTVTSTKKPLTPTEKRLLELAEDSSDEEEALKCEQCGKQAPEGNEEIPTGFVEHPSLLNALLCTDCASRQDSRLRIHAQTQATQRATRETLIIRCDHPGCDKEFDRAKAGPGQWPCQMFGPQRDDKRYCRHHDGQRYRSIPRPTELEDAQRDALIEQSKKNAIEDNKIPCRWGGCVKTALTVANSYPSTDGAGMLCNMHHHRQRKGATRPDHDDKDLGQQIAKHLEKQRYVSRLCMDLLKMADTKYYCQKRGCGIRSSLRSDFRPGPNGEGPLCPEHAHVAVAEKRKELAETLSKQLGISKDH